MKTTCDYCKDIKTSQEAYWYLSSEGVRDLVCEEIIKKDPKYVYLYCLDVIKNRWIEGEPSLIGNTQYMLYYSVGVLRDVLPQNLHRSMLMFHLWNSDDYTRQYFLFLESLKDRNNIKEDTQEAVHLTIQGKSLVDG